MPRPCSIALAAWQTKWPDLAGRVYLCSTHHQLLPMLFVLGRLGGQEGTQQKKNYGTLPRGVDTKTIIERAQRQNE